MTSEPGIYAAGNVLRGADMHDICALEGRQATINILAHLRSGRPGNDRIVRIRALDPLRYAVPQKLLGHGERQLENILQDPRCFSPGAQNHEKGGP